MSCDCSACNATVPVDTRVRLQNAWNRLKENLGVLGFQGQNIDGTNFDDVHFSNVFSLLILEWSGRIDEAVVPDSEDDDDYDYEPSEDMEEESYINDISDEDEYNSDADTSSEDSDIMF